MIRANFVKKWPWLENASSGSDRSTFNGYSTFLSIYISCSFFFTYPSFGTVWDSPTNVGLSQSTPLWGQRPYWHTVSCLTPFGEEVSHWHIVQCLTLIPFVTTKTVFRSLGLHPCKIGLHPCKMCFVLLPMNVRLPKKKDNYLSKEIILKK